MPTLATQYPAKNVGRLDINDGRACLSAALRSCSNQANTNLDYMRRRRSDLECVDAWLLDIFRPREAKIQHVGNTISGLRWNAAVVPHDEGRTVVFGFWHPALIGSLQVWRGPKVIKEAATVLERF